MEPLARILVVDNDPSVGDDLQLIFSTLNYQVELAQGSGPALLADALQRAQRFRPHIAIIDVRLLDDYSDELSGVTLLKPFASARCILYSAHLTADLVREALRDHVYDWINKADRPERLIGIVERAAKSISAASNDLAIHWPQAWQIDEILAQVFADDNGKGTVSTTLLDDIMVQLYPAHHALYPTTMNGAVATPTATSRHRSFVTKIQPDNLEPQVAKVAKAGDVAQEVTCYNDHIKDRLSGHFHTRLERHATFWNVGIALYSFLGTPLNDIRTFSSFYQEQSDSNSIFQPLKHFFTEVWRRHYDERTPFHRHTTLYDIYKDEFGLDKKLERQPNRSVYQLFDRVQPSLPDPIQWLSRHRDDNSIPRLMCATVHGDLHGDNLFVNDRYAWVIDFERTGPSHALRDFAELEIDILTRLVDAKAPYGHGFPTEFYHTLIQIMDVSAVAAPSMATAIAVSTEMRKAIETIQWIRQSASTLAGYREPREYLWALLYYAIFACYM